MKQRQIMKELDTNEFLGYKEIIQFGVVSFEGGTATLK